MSLRLWTFKYMDLYRWSRSDPEALWRAGGHTADIDDNSSVGGHSWSGKSVGGFEGTDKLQSSRHWRGEGVFWVPKDSLLSGSSPCPPPPHIYFKLHCINLSLGRSGTPPHTFSNRFAVSLITNQKPPLPGKSRSEKFLTPLCR